MSGPLNQISVEKAPCTTAGIDFEQHVSIGIVASGGHHVMLRAIGVATVDPLVQVPADDELDGVLVLAQDRQ